jgi:anti-sigma B factor antagonist
VLDRSDSEKLLEIDRIDGGLRIRGEVDLSNVERFAQEVHGAARPGTELLIDLSECEYMGSEGIGVLIQAWKIVRDDGGKLVLRSPNTTLRRVLVLAGLEKFPQVDMPTEAAG